MRQQSSNCRVLNFFTSSILGELGYIPRKFFLILEPRCWPSVNYRPTYRYYVSLKFGFGKFQGQTHHSCLYLMCFFSAQTPRGPWSLLLHIRVSVFSRNYEFKRSVRAPRTCDGGGQQWHLHIRRNNPESEWPRENNTARSLVPPTKSTLRNKRKQEMRGHRKCDKIKIQK